MRVLLYEDDREGRDGATATWLFSFIDGEGALPSFWIKTLQDLIQLTSVSIG